MIHVTYGKGYLWQMYYGKCNYYKCVYGKSIMYKCNWALKSISIFYLWHITSDRRLRCSQSSVSVFEMLSIFFLWRNRVFEMLSIFYQSFWDALILLSVTYQSFEMLSIFYLWRIRVLRCFQSSICYEFYLVFFLIFLLPFNCPWTFFLSLSNHCQYKKSAFESF